jgi:YVTN family beta-propeller protein
VPGRRTERFLTAVLFTDIVGSTEVAAELGDRGWRELVQEHHRLVRAALQRHHGREVDTAGDGFFAIFDAPAEAAECALDAAEAVQALGIQIRAGIHVGEVEQMGAKVGGIAVPTAARIMAAAGGSEVLASGTVRDLAAGSGLYFEDRGERELKGVPGSWRLYAVTRSSAAPTVTEAPAAQTPEDRAARRAAAIRRSEARPFWQRHPRASAGVAVVLALAVAAAGALVWSPWRPKALAGVAENAIGVIDPGRNEIVGQASLDDQPAAIAVGDGSVWVTNQGSNTVSRVNPSTQAVVDSIDVGKGPVGVATSNGSVWVADSGARSVSRINVATGHVVATIATGNSPTAIAVGSGGVWVANTGDGTITRIDLASGHAAPAVSVGSLPDALAIDGTGLWVASQDGATVSHLDPTSGAALAAPIPVGSRPGAITLGAGSVWVANTGDGTVSRIDPKQDRVTGTVVVGGAPAGLAMDGTTLWVADATGAVERVDTAASSGGTPIRVATVSAPQAIAIAGHEVWFASRASEASHRGGILRVVSRDPIALDPNAFTVAEFQSLIGDGLVGYRRIAGIAGSQLLPHLAIAITPPTDGGLTYAFHLRSGLRYSNGTPLLASDFVYAMERVFQVADPDFGNVGASFYASVVGAEACMPAPVKDCDLSQGVVADDAARSVTFHLTKPDPDFLYKLAIDFAFPVRKGTVPDNAFASKPYPGIGPYQVASASATTIRLTRNPNFRSWDQQVRPAGFVDEMLWTSGIDPEEQVKMVEAGTADYMVDQIPADAFATLETNFTPQLHIAAQTTTFLFFNTQRAPFDKLALRQAVSVAIDRTEVSKLRGGSGAAQVTCQILPPNFPGYEPYCPYSADPAPNGRGPWNGPDLAAARKLVAASGAAKTPIVVGPFSPRLNPIASYVVGLLRAMGFQNVTEKDATEGSQVFKAIFEEKSFQISAFEFIQDYPGPDTFLGQFTCGNPDNFTFFCDPSLDKRIEQARDLQTTDAAAAARAWAVVDRKVIDLGLWCPLVNEGSDVVSARVGNYQYNLSYGMLLDQAWVK